MHCKASFDVARLTARIRRFGFALANPHRTIRDNQPGRFMDICLLQASLVKAIARPRSRFLADGLRCGIRTRYTQIMSLVLYHLS